MVIWSRGTRFNSARVLGYYNLVQLLVFRKLSLALHLPSIENEVKDTITRGAHRCFLYFCIKLFKVLLYIVLTLPGNIEQYLIFNLVEFTCVKLSN